LYVLKISVANITDDFTVVFELTKGNCSLVLKHMKTWLYLFYSSSKVA